MISKNSKSGSHTILIATSVLLLSLLGTFIFFYLSLVYDDDAVPYGVSVDGVDIGGLTREEALEKLKKVFILNPQKYIVLYFEDVRVSLKFSDLKVNYNFDEVLDRIFKLKKEGNIFSRFYRLYSIKNNGMNFSLKIIPDYNAAVYYLTDLSNKINRDPQNARLEFKKGERLLIPEVYGVKMDIEGSYSRLVEAINKGDRELQVAVNMIKPNITSEDLRDISYKISTFTTTFNPQDVNRTSNLILAAKNISGALVRPGEIYSLNKGIGPRVIEAGFKEAPVIINGKLVPGIGGGVCQIATTVYNAVLRADLKIVERFHHSFPVSYVPPGQDATLSGDILDLKFQNNSSYPIYLVAYVYSNKFTVDVYSADANFNKRVVIYSEILEVIEPKITYKEDNTMPEGTIKEEVPPHKGYKVNTYRLVYEGSKLIRKEKLSYDFYQPVNGIIIKGTKKSEVINQSGEQGAVPQNQVDISLPN